MLLKYHISIAFFFNLCFSIIFEEILPYTIIVFFITFISIFWRFLSYTGKYFLPIKNSSHLSRPSCPFISLFIIPLICFSYTASVFKAFCLTRICYIPFLIQYYKSYFHFPILLFFLFLSLS